MEFWRKKNTDTRVVFPIQKNDGTFITGAAGLDSEFALLGAHGAAAPSFGDCTHEATEIRTTNSDADVVNWKGSAAAAMTGDAYAAIGTAQTMLTDIHATDLPAVKTD